MAIYKRGREFELGTTEHKSSKSPERDSNPGPPDSGASNENIVQNHLNIALLNVL